jgi:hypothetical protein
MGGEGHGEYTGKKVNDYKDLSEILKEITL